MRILAVGGGSGGHVTPIIAVLRELKQRSSGVEVRVWCDHKYAPQARELIRHFDATIPVQTIFSGKLRRYHHLKWWQYLTSPSVTLPNIRDVFLVAIGFVQCVAKFIVWRPDVVFAKGGFVCVPAGIAAWILRIPLVIHDSDSHPGLANRILARFATLIATGAPLDNYPYNKNIAYYTGIPISQDFYPYSNEERQKMKAKLGFKPHEPLVVITGGGTGAGHINEAVAKSLDALLKVASVMLLSGAEHYDKARSLTPKNNERFQLLPFITSSEMARALGAADIVVSRAGATTILELSALAKPTILIPNARLTAGHQLKNAAEYARGGAAEVIAEEELTANPQLIVDTISLLLSDPARQKQMAKKFHAFSKLGAAREVADLIEKAEHHLNMK